MPIMPKLKSVSALKLTLLFTCLLTACQIADAQRSGGFVGFSRTIVDDAMSGGYGVDSADIDGDGLPDIVALSTNPARFVWYRNPDWQRFDISSRTTGNIAMAPHDIDDDGDVDLVLASEFSLQDSTEGGLLQWFENPGNPQEQQEWVARRIDAVPTSHRVRWADVNGDGRLELINLPIIGVGATAPDYAVDLALTAYAIPPNPRREPWPGVTLDNSLQMAHGLTVVNWDSDDRADLLTASFSGVDLFQLGVRGRIVARTALGAGQTGLRPRIGSSEVGLGRLSREQRFIATIEPWHGNQVVVYTPGGEEGELWQRRIIESDFADGHGLAVADLDNDGQDEIIAGFRGEPFGLFIYRFDSRENQWQALALDEGGIALSGLVVRDLDQDGFRDIVGIGSATGNVVLYRNRGR
ncbi:MAG: hypothetical protein RLZZ385_377 [Pseudomonadota bacterium]|jgi:hypothetical protein